VEYAAEPIRPGIFRKLSVFRVADRYLPHVCVHDVGWIIKAGRMGVATTELYDEELEILRSNRYADCMKRVFELAQIDFGRVDFSFVDGQACIYEINTNPTIASPYPHPIPQRVESMEIWWKGLLAALHAINGPDERSLVDVRADDAATLLKALDMYPAIKDGFLHLSEAHSRSGNREAAVQCARSALAVAPHDSKVLLGVSRLMAKNDGLQEAIDLAQRGVELDANNVELLLQSARLLIGAKRGTEALAAVNHAISVRPKDVRCYRALIEVQRLIGDLRAALETTTIVAKLISANSGPAVAKQLKELGSQRRALQVEAMQKRVRRFFHSARRWKT
jgi:tetratricopeptide (TPR) repeat protein